MRILYSYSAYLQETPHGAPLHKWQALVVVVVIVAVLAVPPKHMSPEKYANSLQRSIPKQLLELQYSANSTV